MSLQPEHFKVREFQLDTDKSNVSEITLSSRYPEDGYALNTVSEMTVFVLSGKVSLSIEGRNVVLETGSTMLVKTNEPYFWQPLDTVTLLIFSVPGWTPEQQRIIQ